MIQGTTWTLVWRSFSLGARLSRARSGLRTDTRSLCETGARSGPYACLRSSLLELKKAESIKRRRLALVFAFFEHVLDGGFVNHQIRFAILAVHLDAIPVIPLDNAVNFFAVTQHDDHGRPRLHLLLIVEIFGVGLLRRSCFFSGA